MEEAAEIVEAECDDPNCNEQGWCDAHAYGKAIRAASEEK
jgi:hypothetical protein